MSGARREISAEHVAELEYLGLDYWWSAVRCANVEAALLRRHPPGACRYLDVGCGPATLTAHVADALGAREVLGLDATDDALALARARGVGVRRADFRQPLDLPFEPDAITCLDVLEHLDEPVRLLRHLADASAPDAVLIVTVPALPSLYATWDELAGHRRRYTRRDLVRDLEVGGWQPLRVRYFFGYCVLPAWIERRLLRRTRRFEFPRVSAPVNGLLTALGRMERALGHPLPVGTSLLAEARRAPASQR